MFVGTSRRCSGYSGSEAAEEDVIKVPCLQGCLMPLLCHVDDHYTKWVRKSTMLHNSNIGRN